LADKYLTAGNTRGRNADMARFEAKTEVTGIVALIETKVGDRIDSGDPVLFIESMKMQIPVIVEETGTLRQIMVAQGDAVAEGQVVAILEI
jgi:acetyl-CoA carboxylase biotin carboxyl carrier protein